MKNASKLVLGGLVVAATLLVTVPNQAEARRWVYYAPVAPAPMVVASPVVVSPGSVYSTYYPVYPRRAYRSYYAPTYVVPGYAPSPYMWYGY